ncbi:MAG TPA: isocitrate lyase/phosphoenolpyruvate mutase family protein, partial [Baekduia sp.]|nr:isocitrate lyase/phosphoenolpyruvate mutase family protein [Baekduia sp.]
MPAAADKPSPDDLRDRAQELRRLHADPAILVLVNVWDAASARTVASVPGCRAIATASWAIAAAHGLADGEAIGREGMLAAVGCVASAVDLPVTADLEGGYGETPADVGETIARAIDAGAVGCNLEDGIRGGELLRDAEDATA